MWICPKCGRTFKNQNQGHYCGKAPETIEVLIDTLGETYATEELREALEAGKGAAVFEGD